MSWTSISTIFQISFIVTLHKETTTYTRMGEFGRDCLQHQKTSLEPWTKELTQITQAYSKLAYILIKQASTKHLAGSYKLHLTSLKQENRSPLTLN